MSDFPYRIRPIKIEQDASGIAALVRDGFRPWLDHENLAYLDHLEKAGNEARSFPIWTSLAGFPYTMTGVVCINEAGSIIGVISTYPFYLRNRKCCLIANVCVAPEYRRQGIAGHMIEEAADLERQSGSYGLYLQTRMAQKELVTFYMDNGFTVTDYRETWILPAGSHPVPSGGMCLQFVPGSEMAQFHSALDLRYPETVRWNLDYSEDLFQSGKFSNLLNRLSFSGNRFYRVQDERGTAAWAACQTGKEGGDSLWFIPCAGISGTRLGDALRTACSGYKGKNSLKLDVPAGSSESIYRSIGFVYQQTLAWMWRRL